MCDVTFVVFVVEIISSDSHYKEELEYSSSICTVVVYIHYFFFFALMNTESFLWCHLLKK